MNHGPPHETRYTNGESGEDPQTYGHREKFLTRTPMAWAVRSRIDKWDLVKLQSFCKAMDTVNETKRQPTDWEKIFTIPILDRGLISSIYREFKKLTSENQITLFKMGYRGKQRILN